MQNERSFEQKESNKTFHLSIPKPLETKKEILPLIEKTSLFVPTRYLSANRVGFLPSSISPEIFVTRNTEELMRAIFKYGETANRYGIEGLEEDITRQQIIIYTMVACQGNLLWYKRSAKGGDPRLQGKFSIGFGGHKTREDISFSREELVFLGPGLSAIKDEVGTLLGLNRGLFAEVQEEIGVGRDGIKDLKILGGFADRRKEDPSLEVQVGEVHVGVAAYLEIEPLVVSHLALRSNEIAEAWWVPFEKIQDELQTRQENYKAGTGAKVEGWTEIMIKEFSKDLRHKV